MYLVSWIEEEAKVEASLGGRVTAEEMYVFAEELRDVIAEFGERPYVLTIDHSRAKPFDVATQRMLTELKDEFLNGHAHQVVSVVHDEDALAQMTHERLQSILEGRESVALAAIDEELLAAPAATEAEIIELPFLLPMRKAA